MSKAILPVLLIIVFILAAGYLFGRYVRKGVLLTLLIIVGLVVGCIYGQAVLFDVADPIGANHWTKQAGELILIRPLMLMIIPLVFVSGVCGGTSIGDPA